MGQTINQVRHLYVTNDAPTLNTEPTAKGNITLMAPDDTKTVWFKYMSPAGLVSSDKIDVANIEYMKVTPAKAMGKLLKVQAVKLDANINEGNPVAGQEYILRLVLKNYIGMGDDNVAFKYGMTTATTDTTATDLYKKLALSLVKNLKDMNNLVNVYLGTADTDVPVTADTKESTLTDTYTDIIIEQVPQAWELGKMPETVIDFDVQGLPITLEGDEVLWLDEEAKNAETPSHYLPNGKNIADLEYFCMGARGDYYRGMGYPNNIKTDYMVDPTQEYDTLDIHYSYVGANESVQKSEKDITIAVPTGTDFTVVTDILTQLSGVKVKTVTVNHTAGKYEE